MNRDEYTAELVAAYEAIERAEKNSKARPFRWYVATPYAKYPGGQQQAWVQAVRATAALAASGLNVYSPNAHWHPVAAAAKGMISPTDHDFWNNVNSHDMSSAHGLVVVKLASWQESTGVAAEIKMFDDAGKPVVYIPVEGSTEAPNVLAVPPR